MGKEQRQEKQRLKLADSTAVRESIVIKGEFLSNKTIYMAFNDLMKGYYSHEVAYQLEKFSRQLNKVQKQFALESEAIIKKYAVLDKNGQPERKMEPKIMSNGEVEMKPKMGKDGVEKDANGAPVMEPVLVPVDFLWRDVVETNAQGEEITTPGFDLANIEFSELGEKEYTLDVYKFNRFDFREAKLTVAQWMSLDPIFTEPMNTEDEED